MFARGMVVRIAFSEMVISICAEIRFLVCFEYNSVKLIWFSWRFYLQNNTLEKSSWSERQHKAGFSRKQLSISFIWKVLVWNVSETNLCSDFNLYLFWEKEKVKKKNKHIAFTPIIVANETRRGLLQFIYLFCIHTAL